MTLPVGEGVRDPVRSPLRESIHHGSPTESTSRACHTDATTLNTPSSPRSLECTDPRAVLRPIPTRRGKAPPIEFFSGEDPAILLEDWMPSLERAADWNEWTQRDKLIQLPGYLKGQALQEWHLLGREEQQSYPKAVDALRARLDLTNKTIAAQEFRHHAETGRKCCRIYPPTGESLSGGIRQRLPPQRCQRCSSLQPAV